MTNRRFQRDCFLRDLAKSDEEYRSLLESAETIRASFLHQEHRLSTYEEEIVHPVFLCMDEADLIGTKVRRLPNGRFLDHQPESKPRASTTQLAARGASPRAVSRRLLFVASAVIEIPESRVDLAWLG